jgi:hypothetical protein
MRAIARLLQPGSRRHPGTVSVSAKEMTFFLDELTSTSVWPVMIEEFLIPAAVTPILGFLIPFENFPYNITFIGSARTYTSYPQLGIVRLTDELLAQLGWRLGDWLALTKHSNHVNVERLTQ